MDSNATVTMTTTMASLEDINSTSPAPPSTVSSMHVFEHTKGQLFDFRAMALTDWDDVHMQQGDQLYTDAYSHWNAVNIARLALALWIIMTHLAIILFILVMRNLRAHPKNLLIINVCLAHILLGGFVVPAKLAFTLWPEVAGCDLSVGWTFISDYYQTSVSLFAVLFLVVERFIYVYFTEKKQKNIKPVCKIISTIIFFILPWIISIILLLPTFFAGLLARSVEAGSCLFKVNDSYFLACQLLAFIPASLGVFIITPFTGLIDCLRPKHCFYTPITPRGESSTVTTIITLLSVFCEVPFTIVRVLMMRMECNSPECVRLAEGLTLAWWVRLAKAAVFPFIWLAYTDIRDAMKCRVDCEYLCGDNWEDPWGPIGDDEKIEDSEPGASYPLTKREQGGS